MKEFNLIYNYYSNEHLIEIGYTPIADLRTFNFYWDLLESKTEFYVSFIPFDTRYQTGTVKCVPSDISFSKIDEIGENSIIIDFINDENVNLISEEQKVDLEEIKKILSKSSGERLRKIAGIIK